MKHFGSLSHKVLVRATGCCSLTLVLILDLEAEPSSSDDLILATRPDHMNISIYCWIEPRKTAPHVHESLLFGKCWGCLFGATLPSLDSEGSVIQAHVWGWGMTVPSAGPNDS